VLTDLKILMLRKGLSQRELAEAMNLSCCQVSRLINERVRLRAHHRRMIAQFLRVPQAEIFRVKARSQKPRNLRQRIRREGGGQKKHGERSN
jgi:transcriptional regulator with XRE-family HTH domain